MNRMVKFAFIFSAAAIALGCCVYLASFRLKYRHEIWMFVREYKIAEIFTALFVLFALWMVFRETIDTLRK